MRPVCRLSFAAFALTAGLTLPPAASADDRVAQMTLEEKAGMVTGQNSWQTLEIERLGIPPAWMADGPVGLRKSTGLEVTASLPATCFPSSAAMAATWNLELIEQLGAGIGAEARFHDVALLLAPGLNLKRHPRGGRNFEYYSEDPLLAGRMAAAFVRGVQSQGVGATLKHYAVNNQEHRRMTIDAQVDERTLRELYLRGFEIAVKEGQPQAIMSAYNRVNGTYASESHHLLSDILRGEWGYGGVVVSDWGAVDDPAESVTAGLDLEMPGNPFSPAEVVRAVQEGRLDEADLDSAVARVLQLVDRQVALAELPKDADHDANHDLARQVAIEGMVLLENDALLPITGSGRKIGVVGNLAFRPRIQGVGSSQINVTRLDVPWEHLERIGGEHGHEMAAWQTEYDENGMSDGEGAELEQFLDEQEVVLVFAGQKASHDAEAWDRPSTDLSPGDAQLVEAARDSGKPFAVVLVGGGTMNVAAADGAGALIMGWLGGQAFGSGIAEVIFGDSAPSGRLSETFAHSVADHPSDLNFPAGPRVVQYGERFHVGYRHFQTNGRPVAYPFGYGLTYTTFTYADATAPATLDSLDDGFDVSVEVTNTGERRGAETVQVYLRHLEPELERPDRELIGFQKLALDPGETGTATIHVEAERLAYYHDGFDQWVIEPGRYELLVAASAADVKATLPLEVTAGTKPRAVYTVDDIMGDIARDPRGLAVADFMLEAAGMRPLSGAAEDDFFAAIFRNMPFKKLAGFSAGKVTPQQLEQLMQLINSDMDSAMVTAILEQAAASAEAAEASEAAEDSPPSEDVPAETGEWQLVWADEFDGETLDLESWTVEVMPDPHNEELQYYPDRLGQPESNIWLEDGALVIEAREEVYEHRRYTSGRIKTQGKREFLYGRFEARMRLPDGVGMWPAFWLLGGNIDDVGWPACGEIDVMEGKGRLPSWTSGAIHRGPDPDHNEISVGEYELPEGDFHRDWHVFAVEWQPKQIRWYVDGKQFFGAGEPKGDPAYWPFDHGHPFFILLNLAVGGWFDEGHPPPPGMEPQRLYVDYVRVYRQ